MHSNGSPSRYMYSPFFFCMMESCSTTFRSLSSSIYHNLNTYSLEAFEFSKGTELIRFELFQEETECLIEYFGTDRQEFRRGTCYQHVFVLLPLHQIVEIEESLSFNFFLDFQFIKVGLGCLEFCIFSNIKVSVKLLPLQLFD